jgi:hypothetical protein
VAGAAPTSSEKPNSRFNSLINNCVSGFSPYGPEPNLSCSDCSCP